MIEWVETMLLSWGDYSQRREDGGLGYAKGSPMFRLSAAGGAPSSVVLAESDVLQIERVMVGIKADRPELYAVAIEWYVRKSPTTTVAMRIGCHRNSVQARIAALHVLVANRIAVRAMS